MSKNLCLACKAIFALLFLATSHTQAQPKITSITPISAPVGASVTITGSGFNTSAGSNTVLFGSIKAPVTSASATSLTVTVPASTAYQTISVVNIATHLTGYYNNQFITSYAGTTGLAIIPSSFQPKVDFYFYYVTHPGAFTFSDLDGDGKIDLSYLDIPSFQRDPSALYISRNESTPGTIDRNIFGSGFTSNPGRVNGGLTASDMNGDGKQDLLVGLVPPVRTLLMLNSSTPGTLNSSSFTGGAFLSGTAVYTTGDVDADGITDILSLNNDSTLSVQRGLLAGASLFASAVKFPAGNNPSGIDLTDLDGDGRPEIIIRNNRDNLDTAQIAVLRNTSTPGALDASSFAPKVNFNLLGSSFYTSMVIGDVDGDGKPDISVGLPGPNGSVGRIAVLRNISTQGSFTNTSLAAEVDFPAGIAPRSVRLGDINGDGKPDLIYVNNNSGSGNTISFLLNSATAGNITPSSFSQLVSIPAPNAGSAFLQDIDADGKPDIVTYDEGGGPSFSIFKLRDKSSLPVITSISPASAPADATVTITGTNFNPSFNVIYFGAVQVGANTTSSTSLVVKVPRGATYQPVSVLNPATGLTAYSSQPFLPTFNNALGQGISSGFYKPRIDFAAGAPAGAVPYSFAIGDIEGDGKSDMAVVYANSSSVTVLHNTSSSGSITTASFTEMINFATGTNPLSVVLKDMDGDGRLDLVVANNGTGTVSVLRNTAYLSPGITASSFAPKVDFPVSAGSSPYAIAVSDVNSDGLPDIIVANSGSNTITVLPNTSLVGSITASSFGAKVDFATGSFPRALATGDVDGDGKPDVIVTNELDKSISVLRNTAATGSITAASFDPHVDFTTGNSSPSVILTDVDGDGKADLVTANYNSNTVSVMRNLSTAGSITTSSFAAKVDFATGLQPFSVAAGDANGDGRPDLVVANSGSNTASILRNTAVGGGITASSFADKTDFATGVYPISAAMADLDNDGATDVAVVNANSGSISVLKIDYSLLRPVITSFTPPSGPAGSSVTITGTNFSDQYYNTTIYFGAEAVTVAGGSATSLTVTVPAGATYKQISVLNGAYGLTGYSAKPFTPTFANPFGTGIPANYYRPKVDFPTASLPYFEAIGDVDRDGKPDVVVVNANANTVSLLHNISATGSIDASSFERADFATGNDPRSVALADVDGDSRLDIVVANAGSSTVSVLLNKASLGYDLTSYFAARVDFATGSTPFSIAIDDVNADGKADLIVANTKGNTVSVLINTVNTGSISASSFAPKVDFPAGTFPRFVAVGDVDGDGRPDLVVANEQSNTVSVMRSTTPSTVFSSAAFGAPVSFTVGSQPNSVSIGDVNGDGRPELAVSNYGSSNISVLYNTSVAGSITASSFAAAVNFAVNPQPFFAAMADADGDGKVDLVSANSGSNTISVLRNTATAGSITASSFAAKRDFTAGGYPTSLAVGDLDGDGIAEVVTSNAGNNTVSVLKVNAPVSPVSAGALRREDVLAPDQQNMQVYPNPAKGAFTLQLAGMKGEVAEVEIFSEEGRSVVKRTVNLRGKAGVTMQLNLQGQPAGVYYVKATSTGGVQITKVVVQR